MTATAGNSVRRVRVKAFAIWNSFVLYWKKADLLFEIGGIWYESINCIAH